MAKNVDIGGFDFAQASTVKNNRAKSNIRQNRLNTVVVQSFSGRCMAFRDRAGQLRNFWSGKVLPLPVHILDPEG